MAQPVLFFALGHAVRLTRRQLAGVAVAAVLGITINQLLFIGGLTRTSAVNAGSGRSRRGSGGGGSSMPAAAISASSSSPE